MKQARKRVLLIEPSYRNKYPPLGLMKLASYHRERGDHIQFTKLGFGGSEGMLPLLDTPWDRVYVTSLFSFEWKRTSMAVDQAIQFAGGQTERVFVGGIAASLMHDEFTSVPRWAGVRFIQGLLDGPPAKSLQLSERDCEFGAGDLEGIPIDERIPDYSILEHIEYEYPVRDAYFGYASRGCVRKCSFCGVPKLEGAQKEMPPLARLVEGVDALHGPRKDLVLMDNNVTASSRYQEVIAEIRDLGFQAGATFARSGEKPSKRRVDFNQGVDARILSKSPMFLREMATICISPLRIAFDHIGVRKPYETSVRMAADYGLRSLSNYMLYNFMDSPKDLYQRMRLNIELNQELGVRIWSFPMRYQPVTLKDRSHVGKKWNRYYLRSFQVMLQATHGVVSGSPSFFERAYGDSPDGFEQLLGLPHAFIFHRDHYEFGAGRGVLDEYLGLRRSLSQDQESQLLSLLAEVESNPGSPKRKRYALLASDRTLDRLVRRVASYHTMDTRTQPITESTGVLTAFDKLDPDPALMPAEDELVEDAGLFEQDTQLIDTSRLITLKEYAADG